MRDFAVLTILFGSLPFILAQPYIGILVWSWISYMNPHRLTWAAQQYPVAALVAGALFVGLLFSRESKQIPWSSITVTWVLFVLWMSLSTLFALQPDAAWEQWEKVMKIQLMSFLTLVLMQTRERLNWLVIVIVASIGFFSIKGGVFTLVTGGQYTTWGPPGSFIEGNNELGLAVVMIIPFMNYLRQISTRSWVRRLLLVAMIFSGLTVLATYSRGALLAAGAMILFLIWKTPRRSMFIIGALLVIPLLLTFMPERWQERMSTITEYRQDASAMGRINAWYFAYNLAVDRPIVGGGFETFDPELFIRYAPDPTDFHDAHSIYFEVLGEHGFPGLFLFVLLGWLTWRMARAAIKQAQIHPELTWAGQLAAMAQVSMVGFAVGGLFLGLAYFDLYYHVICIVVLTHLLVTRQLAELDDKNVAPPAFGHPVAGTFEAIAPGVGKDNRYGPGAGTG